MYALASLFDAAGWPTLGALLAVLSFAVLGFVSAGLPWARRAKYATQTTAVGHYYANGTSGDDANDGLTAATPKKTLQAVFDLVPYLVKHNTCVHLAGTFSEFGNCYLERFLTGGSVLLVDGGTDTTTVADDGGSPWTADIASTSSIGLTTAGWTIDAYAGYMVTVISGAAAGQTRLIQGNSETTITPQRNFSVSPGAAQFRISRPATTLSASSTNSWVRVHRDGALASVLFVQNLFMTGSKCYIDTGYNMSGQPAQLTHIVNNCSQQSSFYSHSSMLLTSNGRYDPATFAQAVANTDSNFGISQIHSSGSLYIANYNNNSIQGSYVYSLLLERGFVTVIGWGTRIVSLSMRCIQNDRSTTTISSTANYATTKIGGGSVGVTAIDSVVRIGAGVDISNCASHGIECNHSRLHLDGAVTGADNGGAGVYAHSGSVVHIKNGAPPTLTGTVGDLAVSNPAAEESTWAAIDAGTPVAVTAEMTMAKEVA